MVLSLSRILVALILLSISNLASFAAAKPDNPPEIMPLEQVHAGMHGVAYTVFEGVDPEPMDVEILGIQRNAAGPRNDLILVRLHGPKPEYTGVVAGMSGSPVYVDGKLIGALSYRIGDFSKEPIGGVTPIAQMLEINELDATRAPAVSPATASAASVSHPEAQGMSAAVPAALPPGNAQLLRPIDTPLVFSGFTEDAMRQFAPEFRAAGIVPVMGVGSMSDDKQPQAIVPGSAVSMVLVRGDMQVAATCTVTYADAERLLACGHPVLQFGALNAPMNKARVMATLPSPLNSFKIVDVTEPVGAFVQDRHSGILGRFGQAPEMIPVQVSVHGGPQPRQYHYEVLNNPKLTPVAMMSTLFSSLQNVNDFGVNTTYRVQGKISVEGYPDITLQNMYAPVDGGASPALSASLLLGDRISRVYENPYARPQLKGVELEFDMVNDRRSARLESARTDVTEARPGDEIVVEAVLRPYRGERIVRQMPVKIPTSTPKGTLRILMSDGDTLDRTRRISSSLSQRLDLGTTIALLNKEHANNRLYVSMLEPNPQAMIEDKIMPTLPVSVLNVLDGLRGTQDLVVVGESAVSETSTPLDYVVSGSQVISISIK